MIMPLTAFLLRSLVLLAVVGFVAISLYLYQDNRKSERFTAEIDTLLDAGPLIVQPSSNAGRPAPQLSADVQQIQAIYQKHNQAWCQGDGAAYASVFTDDADFIAFDGTHTVGRSNIAESHQALFDRYVRNTCLHGAITRIRFVTEDAAIVHVASGTRFDGREIVRRPSIQTYVAVRQGQDWSFASFHNGRIDPIDNWNVFRLAWMGAKTWLFRR